MSLFDKIKIRLYEVKKEPPIKSGSVDPADQQGDFVKNERDKKKIMRKLEPKSKQTELNFEYLTKMYFEPNTNGSEAGISFFQKDDNYINYTLIKDNGKHYLQAYVVKNGELISTLKEHFGHYKGHIKLKVIVDKDAYKLYYMVGRKHSRHSNWLER